MVAAFRSLLRGVDTVIPRGPRVFSGQERRNVDTARFSKTGGVLAVLLNVINILRCAATGSSADTFAPFLLFFAIYAERRYRAGAQT
jgi:hypothetical protein